jgi:hypothetical protein
MFLYWECKACGIRRHASVSEIAYDGQGRLKSWMCPCKSGLLKMFKSKEMPKVTESGYAGGDPLANIPDGDAATTEPGHAPLTVPGAGPEEAPSNPVAAALMAGAGKAGPKPHEGAIADDEVAQAWEKHAAGK